MNIIAIIAIVSIIFMIGFSLWSRQNEMRCDAPFIRNGDYCCLDQNNDGACDESESQSTNIESLQDAISSVDRLTTKYSFDCVGGIKENVLYVVHIIQSQNYTECLKLKERIDLIKTQKPAIFDSYLKIIDDCNINTMYALVRTIRGQSYGKLLPLKNMLSDSDDFYYIYSGCIHEPDQVGGVFSFFQMAVDTNSGVTAGMSTR